MATSQQRNPATDDGRSAGPEGARPEETLYESCTYAGLEYSHGAVKCQAGKVYKCERGSWYPVSPAQDCTET